jgi:AcrR family transcriptional regulator
VNTCKVTFVAPTTTPAGSGRPAPGRTRNARGAGFQLRQEIVDAARDLMEQTGDPNAVTLRAIARQAGISAPSIYLHFENLGQILAAVAAASFRDLQDSVVARRQRAEAAGEDEPSVLVAGCLGYLDFALAQPARYQALFHRLIYLADEADAGPGAEALGLLVSALARCVDTGRSTSTDTYADAVSIWVALHGLAMLRIAGSRAPAGSGAGGGAGADWPPADAATIRSLVERLGRIRPAPAGTGPRGRGRRPPPPA